MIAELDAAGATQAADQWPAEIAPQVPPSAAVTPPAGGDGVALPAVAGAVAAVGGSADAASQSPAVGAAADPGKSPVRPSVAPPLRPASPRTARLATAPQLAKSAAVFKPVECSLSLSREEEGELHIREDGIVWAPADVTHPRVVVSSADVRRAGWKSYNQGGCKLVFVDRGVSFVSGAKLCPRWTRECVGSALEEQLHIALSGMKCNPRFDPWDTDEEDD